MSKIKITLDLQDDGCIVINGSGEVTKYEAFMLVESLKDSVAKGIGMSRREFEHLGDFFKLMGAEVRKEEDLDA